MLYIGKELPQMDIDENEYKPFIRHEWFRKKYMWFAYGLMFLLFITALSLGSLRAGHFIIRLIVFAITYVVHELLHIVTVFRKGDIYLNRSGIYLWLTPNFILSKREFWIFMTLPFLVLTCLVGLSSYLVSEHVGMYLKYIAWINSIIAGSDIINSALIMMMPRNSYFYRGYYKRK